MGDRCAKRGGWDLGIHKGVKVWGLRCQEREESGVKGGLHGDMLTTESRGRCPTARRFLGPGSVCGSALL